MTEFNRSAVLERGRVRLSFEMEAVGRRSEYDGDNEVPEVRIVLESEEKRAFASSIGELGSEVGRMGICIEELAMESPADLARIVSLLERQRRPVMESDLCAPVAEAFGMPLNVLAPRFHSGALSWVEYPEFGATSLVRWTLSFGDWELRKEAIAHRL